MQTRHSIPLWLYAGLVALIGFNLYTVIGGIAATQDYAVLGLSTVLFVRVGLAVLWIVVLFGFIVAAWRQKQSVFRWIAPLLTLYGIVNILQTVIFAHSDYSRGAIPFQVVATALALLPVWWLAWHRKWFAHLT